MAMRKDSMEALKRRPVDDAPRSRGDAASLRGFQLLPGGIFPTVKMRATSDQTGVVNTVETQVSFDTADFDTCADDAGGHAEFSQADLSNNQLICRVTGVYDLLAGARWVPSTITGDPKPVIYELKRNGTVIALATSHWLDSAVLGTGSEVGTKVALDADDTITFHVIHFTGSDKALDAVLSEPFLSMTWEGMFAGVAGAAPSPHNLLDGSEHPDTVAAAALRGAMIIANSTPEWARVTHPGAAGYVIESGALDPLWGKPWTVTALQSITSASDTILANGPTIAIDANADYTLVSAPTIANGADGQQLTIVNCDAGSDGVTLQDDGILSGSNLRLGAASRQLKAGGGSIKLTFDATVGAWVETSYTQLVAVTPLILTHTVDVGNGAQSSQNKEVSSGATDPATFAWTYQGTPSAGTIDVSAGGDPAADWPATILTPFLSLVAPAFNEGTPGVTRTFTPNITVNGVPLTSPTSQVTYLNRRYVGPDNNGGQLLTAEILALDSGPSGQSGLSNSKFGTFFNIDTVAGEYIYYCYRSALGIVSHFSIENEAAKFNSEGTMTHVNDLGYSETFQQYRSENTNLGANKDFRALSAEANNRIFIGPAVNGTEIISNAEVLALDDTADGESRLGPTPGFTYTTIRTEAGSGEYLWYCHPDRVADLTSIKDDSTGFAIGGSYRDDITFTNQWGYQETYRCWRSTNAEILDHAPNVTIT